MKYLFVNKSYQVLLLHYEIKFSPFTMIAVHRQPSFFNSLHTIQNLNLQLLPIPVVSYDKRSNGKFIYSIHFFILSPLSRSGFPGTGGGILGMVSAGLGGSSAFTGSLTSCFGVALGDGVAVTWGGCGGTF